MYISSMPDEKLEELYEDEFFTNLVDECQLTMVLSVSHFKFLIEKVVSGTSRMIVNFAC